MAALEDRLRDALRARARDVAPDPATWERVQSRIRRRQAIAWLAPATAAVAVVAVAVLVVPNFLGGTDNDIEFSPAAPDQAVDEDPDAAGEDQDPSDDRDVRAVPGLERVGAVVWTDGRVVVMQTPEGVERNRVDLAEMVGMSAAPGSGADGFLIAGSQYGAHDCGPAVTLTAQESARESAGSMGRGAECATPPRFSPDGVFAASVVRDGADQALEVRRVTADGTAEAVGSAALEDAPGAVEVAAWVRDPDGRETLYLLDRADGDGVVRPVHFDRSDPEGAADGGEHRIAVPAAIDVAGLPEMPFPEGWRTVAATGRDAGLLLLQAADGQARLWSTAPAGAVDVALPEGLADAGPRAWLSALGDDVLVGDGGGGVWHVDLAPDPARVDALDVAWTGAVLLPHTAPEVEDPEPSEDGPVVTVFMARVTDDGMWVEPTSVRLPTPTVGLARAAMERLVAGGVDDLDTLAPDGTRVLGAAINDGVLRIDLSAQVRDGIAGAQGELLFAQQLAHTAAQFDGVDAVRLLVDGQEITDLWGHADWSQPIEPDEFALSPVVISEVSVEDGVVTVHGEAMTFEGHIDLTLVNPGGGFAEETFTTATCGGPCRGEWTHTFEVRATTPGTWRVKAAEPLITDEGRAPFVAAADVEVE